MKLLLNACRWTPCWMNLLILPVVPQVVQIHYSVQGESSFSITCSRFRGKTADYHHYTHTQGSKRTPKIRFFFKLLNTKTSRAVTLVSSCIHFLFLLIIQKSSCIGSHHWSIWPHIPSLTVAKTWKLEIRKRTEKVYKLHSLSTHLASDKLHFGNVLAQ